MMIDSSYGYGRSAVSAGSKRWVPSSKGYKQRSSYCEFKSEVTVITSSSYGSTQDDEHLCEKREQSLWLDCSYKCSKKHDYGTYIFIYTKAGNYVSKKG